jgi:hypothetical protein
MEQELKKELPKKEFYEKLDEESKDYEAEKELHDMDKRANLLDHVHEFTLQTGNRAYCNCGWGIYLDTKDEIRNGKLYRDGTLII